MFSIKICFLKWEPYDAIIGEAGAEIFYLQPEPKKNIWSRSQGKMARLRNNGFSKILSGNIWHELEPK